MMDDEGSNMEANNKKDQIWEQLHHGFFLSAMEGITNGVFCAERGGGCTMLQLGIYLAEPDNYHKVTAFYAQDILPPDHQECLEFLIHDIKAAKSATDALVCLNLASSHLEWALEAAKTFLQAGGDLIELNVHGGFTHYLSIGKMRAMIFPENQPELYHWAEAFCEQEIPLIVKFNAKSNRTLLQQVLDHLVKTPLVGIHINIRDEKTKQPDYNFVRKIKEIYPFFLLASGYVRSAIDAKGLFEAGADMVGIAEPTVKDPGFISRLVGEYKGITN